MRIVHLNPFFFPYAGGTERRILELGRRLGARHDVHVVTGRIGDAPQEEEMAGIHVHRLPSRFRLERFWNPPLIHTPGVVEAIRRIRPDVVDFHYRWAPNYHRAFLSAGRFSRLAFTYNNTFGEGTGMLRFASHLNDRYTARFIRRADRILCVSRFIRDDLTRHGFPADRLVVVPNGVDAAALRTEADKGQRIDGLAPRTYLAAVGRLVPIKRFDVAIRALRHLPEETHLVICGQGPQLEPLRRLARRLGLADRVHLPGWVPEADKLRTVRDAAAFVHPSRWEAFGIAPLEAMALGAPVTAARVGGLPEIVLDPERLFRPDDPADLARATRRLLQDPDAARQAREVGLRQAAAYSWDAAATQAEQVYEELIHAPLHPPTRNLT